MKPDATVVIAARDLPAYSRLSTSDVTRATLAIDDTSEMLTDTAAVVGQIVVSAGTNGEALSASMLLDVP